MSKYRPATAADVGRQNVQFSNGGSLWTPPMELVDYSQVRSPCVFGAALGEWRYARVPISPEECEHEWEFHRSFIEGGIKADCKKCGKIYDHEDRASNVPIEPQMSESCPLCENGPTIFFNDSGFQLPFTRQECTNPACELPCKLWNTIREIKSHAQE